MTSGEQDKKMWSARLRDPSHWIHNPNQKDTRIAVEKWVKGVTNQPMGGFTLDDGRFLPITNGQFADVDGYMTKVVKRLGYFPAVNSPERNKWGKMLRRRYKEATDYMHSTWWRNFIPKGHTDKNGYFKYDRMECMWFRKKNGWLHKHGVTECRIRHCTYCLRQVVYLKKNIKNGYDRRCSECKKLLQRKDPSQKATRKSYRKVVTPYIPCLTCRKSTFHETIKLDFRLDNLRTGRPLRCQECGKYNEFALPSSRISTK